MYCFIKILPNNWKIIKKYKVLKILIGQQISLIYTLLKIYQDSKNLVY